MANDLHCKVTVKGIVQHSPDTLPIHPLNVGTKLWFKLAGLSGVIANIPIVFTCTEVFELSPEASHMEQQFVVKLDDIETADKFGLKDSIIGITSIEAHMNVHMTETVVETLLTPLPLSYKPTQGLDKLKNSYDPIAVFEAISTRPSP
ncbi:hypothetical protein MHM93_18985 [Pseudoalteromonas sp. MM17-2]|uniref:hypothetical protein n=1 Tax=Pseudoalteromonas sp. MM17-2 TaxID=2917753 RepID=UPI001EF6278D|nr:hypothetical protein [Pseudoalteromonas sp. MM17-2]MCG7546260.1 hypothetical protein [Pseudoalteromonas sp. MM17-2]